MTYEITTIDGAKHMHETDRHIVDIILEIKRGLVSFIVFMDEYGNKTYYNTQNIISIISIGR